MPRKSNGTTTRTRKTTQPEESSAVQPTTAQAAPEALGNKAAAVTFSTPAPIAVMPVKTTARPASANPNGGNLDEEIRRRAYELYLARNGCNGDPVGDWFVAEREVRARYAAAGR